MNSIPSAVGWRAYVDQYLRPDPANGLHVALKQWPIKMRNTKKNREKYRGRALIGSEYELRGEAEFVKEYATMHSDCNKLMKAIVKKRDERKKKKASDANHSLLDSH